jgi:hypothetical protein
MRAEGAATVPELVESPLGRAERVVVGRRENLELVLLALLCPGSRWRLSDLPTSSRPRGRRAPGDPIWYPLSSPPGCFVTFQMQALAAGGEAVKPAKGHETARSTNRRLEALQ